MLNHETESGLFHAVTGTEFSEVVESGVEFFVAAGNIIFNVLSKPSMFKALFSRQSFVWVYF